MSMSKLLIPFASCKRKNNSTRLMYHISHTNCINGFHHKNTVILLFLSFSFLEKACSSSNSNVTIRFLIKIYEFLNGNNPCIGVTHFWVELDWFETKLSHTSRSCSYTKKLKFIKKIQILLILIIYNLYNFNFTVFNKC